MRSLTSALVAASLTLLAAESARADPAGEVLEGWPQGVRDLHAQRRRRGAAAPGRAPRGRWGTAKLFRALRPACEQERVHSVSLRCPTELGCRTSFWQWQSTSGHDPGWLGAQIAAAKARFAVDPARVYAAGYSGGDVPRLVRADAPERLRGHCPYRWRTPWGRGARTARCRCSPRSARAIRCWCRHAAAARVLRGVRWARDRVADAARRDARGDPRHRAGGEGEGDPGVVARLIARRAAMGAKDGGGGAADAGATQIGAARADPR